MNDKKWRMELKIICHLCGDTTDVSDVNQSTLDTMWACKRCGVIFDPLTHLWRKVQWNIGNEEMRIL